MKINGGPDKVFGVYNKQGMNISKTGRTEGAKDVNGLDRIELSTIAQDLQEALKALGKTPEVREAKIAELKEKINSGTYSIDDGDVADSILKSLFLDERV